MKNFIRIVLAFVFTACIMMYAVSVQIPMTIAANPVLKGQADKTKPYLMGSVDDGSCIMVQNVDPTFTFGKQAYFVDTGDARYETWDIDENNKGDLHRIFITQDMALCQSLVAAEIANRTVDKPK